MSCRRHSIFVWLIFDISLWFVNLFVCFQFNFCYFFVCANILIKNRQQVFCDSKNKNAFKLEQKKRDWNSSECSYISKRFSWYIFKKKKEKQSHRANFFGFMMIQQGGSIQFELQSWYSAEILLGKIFFLCCCFFGKMKLMIQIPYFFLLF